MALLLSLNYRKEPQLLRPAEPTPHKLKDLSQLDDQKDFYFHFWMVMHYRNNPVMEETDPVAKIREAVSDALVLYYPLAGRLVEGSNGKVLLDCRGQGILFVEAEANATLDMLGDSIQPPCPYAGEILLDHESEKILNFPLMLIQQMALLLSLNRQEPQLICPAEPTPHELKQLSQLDDQKDLYFHFSMVMHYRNNPVMEETDPVAKIREAVSDALVLYYPLAGRLLEGSNGKVLLDCRGQGILFVEAETNVMLDMLPCSYAGEILLGDHESKNKYKNKIKF